MKKILLAVLAFSVISVGYGQKLRDAQKHLRNAQEKMATMKMADASNSLKEATKTLDALAGNEKVTSKVDYWMTKAFVYSMMAEMKEFASSNPMSVSSEAIDQALKINVNKALEVDGAKNLIINNGFQYFNSGVNNANSNNYKQATTDFEKAYYYLNLKDGKAFGTLPQVDTIRSKALYMNGVSAFYSDNYNQAVKSLELSAKDPITANESNVYLNLANAYGKLNNREKQLATIEKGKKLFPNDANIFAAEINYYIDGGESEKVVAKLEEQIKKEPGREDYHYNLGLTYMELVKRNTGKPEEMTYLLKARESFHNAAEINKDNVNYLYYEGTALFNAAATVDEQLGNETDINKMKKIQEDRNTLFREVIPIFTKVNSKFKQQDKSKLNTSDLAKWEQSLRALAKIYAVLDMTDEYNAVNADLEKL